MLFSQADILNITKDKIELSMQMSQSDFAKAKLLQYLTEPGYLAKITDNEVKFSEFRFEETTEKNGNILVISKGYSGTSLYEFFFEKKINENSFKAFELLKKIFENAILQKKIIPFTAPLFTIISSDFTEILFLPKELCLRSLLNCGDKTYSKFAGLFINENLNNEDSLRFTLSIYAYFLVTGKLPFNEIDSEKRYEDYYDCKFIPLELCEKCKNSDAGKIVTFNLCKGSPMGRKLESSKSLPNINSFFEINNFSLSQKTKDNQKKRILLKHNKTIPFLRKCRKNSFAIKTWAFVIFSALILILGYFIGRKPPTNIKGLTSFQVIETAYTGFNNLDLPLFNSCMTGKAGKNFEEFIAGFYATGKIRMMYEKDAGTLPPSQWFHLKNDTDYWTFGLTNLLINGQTGNLSANYHKRKKGEKVYPVKIENGLVLHKGDTKKFNASYYRLHHQSLDKLFVNFHTTEIETTYDGKKWLISKFDDKFTPVELDTAQFNTKYVTLLKEGNSVFSAIEILRKEYEWLPTEVDLKKGITEIRQFYFKKFNMEYKE
ncbi:MAG: hypothetical protein GX220_01965 [Treponema sp.]|nr:hypothetical protein [Treponema sp.]